MSDMKLFCTIIQNRQTHKTAYTQSFSQHPNSIQTIEEQIISNLSTIIKEPHTRWYKGICIPGSTGFD